MSFVPIECVKKAEPLFWMTDVAQFADNGVRKIKVCVLYSGCSEIGVSNNWPLINYKVYDWRKESVCSVDLLFDGDNDQRAELESVDPKLGIFILRII